MTANYISMIERGSVIPSYGVVCKIAKQCGVPVKLIFITMHNDTSDFSEFTESLNKTLSESKNIHYILGAIKEYTK